MHEQHPTTIGEISAAIGVDVRELIMDGYSLKQIQAVVDGRWTLTELYSRVPEERPMSRPSGPAVGGSGPNATTGGRHDDGA